jgi:CDP-4-dehydro-6-deoxyglucose reductase, E1
MAIDDTRNMLRKGILDKVRDFYEKSLLERQPFVPGESRINYAGRVFDENEVVNLVDSALDFWLTYGRFSKEFEEKLASYLGIKHVLLVNSGSSANLLAFMALTSDKLGNRRIERGDEVITVAAGFPTTVTPIIQYGAVPVFIDIDLATVNVDVSQLGKAISSRTKAVMLAHTLGNPFNVDEVKGFCRKHNLWLIEDNCDALGSRYDGRLTGTFGDIGTSSFYPPHHMTMGEGGAVYTSNPKLYKILLSMRDWGRDCWCDSGQDNTCGKRFSQQLGELPYGYDHKYVYSHFGYNLKATDMQAAIGCAQLQKLDGFTEKRKENWKILHDSLAGLSKVMYSMQPTAKSDPSWFGFLMVVAEDAPFNRDQIVDHLETKGIQTRMLFAGNLIKHPCFDGMRASGEGYRVIGNLANTDAIMNRAFWLGVYPGLQDDHIAYMIETIQGFVSAGNGNK